VLIEDLTNIYFKKPVEVGCRLTLLSRVTYVEHNRLVITVEAYTAKFTDKSATLACTLQLIAKSSKEPGPVHP
jgi:acyl-CoA hydrolase